METLLKDEICIVLHRHALDTLLNGNPCNHFNDILEPELNISTAKRPEGQHRDGMEYFRKVSRRAFIMRELAAKEDEESPRSLHKLKTRQVGLEK